MLHSHPNISIAPETRFLVSAYRRRVSFGDLEDESNRRLVRHVHHPGPALQGARARPGRHGGGDRLRTPPTIGSAVGVVFRAFARRFGAERWGSKFPGYHRDLEAIRRMFSGRAARPRRARSALRRRLAEAHAVVVAARTAPSRPGLRRPITRGRRGGAGPARFTRSSTSACSRAPRPALRALRRSRRGVRSRHAAARTAPRTRSRLARSGRNARGSP